MDKLLESAPCGFLSFDDKGLITVINQTLLDWLGYRRDEIVGKSIETILTLSSRIFYQTHLYPLLKLHTKADEIFISLVTKDGKDIPVISNSVRQVNGQGQFNQTVVIPIYQRRKFEDELLQARNLAEQALNENNNLAALTKDLEERTRELDGQYNKVLALNRDFLQFSKIISHDLQEPIHKISIFSNILAPLEPTEKLSEKKKTAIQKIISATARMNFLTKGLQEYMALDEDTDYTDVNLNQVLDDVKTRIIAEGNFEDLHLVVENLPSITAIESQMALIFYHLIDNSIKFRDESRPLIINVKGVIVHENIYRTIENKYKFDEHLQIVFSDNGIGFDNTYREYVFTLLKQIGGTSKGLGIGLSLIKKIVDKHHGSIQVSSNTGIGTEFIIILPLRRAA